MSVLAQASVDAPTARRADAKLSDMLLKVFMLNNSYVWFS
jgi:hypothetical protein